ncbi:MAG: hypothetical protein CMB80_15030 [Flammeovirgaceae bacterium]|nr:hypothetical protein [Flammeovirgaceae bacterium]|tara:strand:- start:149 stop:820 length:672 start_codon:yes stop_codon:yes gene_type:complete
MIELVQAFDVNGHLIPGFNQSDNSNALVITGPAVIAVPAGATKMKIRSTAAIWFKWAEVNAVVNGTFAADTDWTKGTGWTISSEVASTDASQVGDSDLTQALGVQNENWWVQFVVSAYVAGNVTPVIGTQEGTDRAANGTFAEIITVGAGTDLDIRADVDGDLSVDSVVARKLVDVPSASVVDGSTGDLIDQYSGDIIIPIENATQDLLSVDGTATICVSFYS